MCLNSLLAPVTVLPVVIYSILLNLSVYYSRALKFTTQ